MDVVWLIAVYFPLEKKTKKDTLRTAWHNKTLQIRVFLYWWVLCVRVCFLNAKPTSVAKETSVLASYLNFA